MMDKSRTILHVDDDPLMLQLVADRLQAAGYRVISHSDPTKVQYMLLETGCRVVLLDIDMPQMNGLELLQQVKQHDGGIQVLMLTGVVTMNTVLESMRNGAEACLFKPIEDFTPLLEALQAAFVKVDRWWESLRELNSRKKVESASA